MHEKRVGTEEGIALDCRADRCGQCGSVGACVAARSAGNVTRRAAARRVGEGAWLGGFVVCGGDLRLRAATPVPAEEAVHCVRRGRKGRGNRDDIRVITGRGQKLEAPGRTSTVA